MERILISGEEARKKVLEGLKKGSFPISDSYGPFGNNALLEKGTRITNDGAKILKEITLEDEVEDLGLRKLKEAVAKSNDVVGDGSTTITILTYEILKAGKRSIGGANTTADFLKKLEEEKNFIVSELETMATPIETEEKLIEAATVSVDDKELGELIGSTQFKLGKDGYILAEESTDSKTEIEFLSGVRYDNGVAATQMFNNADNTALELENVHVIVTDATMQNLQPLKDILESLAKAKHREVAIIARGWSELAIQECAMNWQNGLKFYPINAPYTDGREILADITSVVGGKFMDKDLINLEDMQLSDVGYATRIKAGRFNTIISGKGEKVAERIEKLKANLEGVSGDFDRRALKARIAQLSGGFALMKVGGPSDTERKRLFDKVEDAANAVRAAFQDGVVPGGGQAFMSISAKMPEGSLLKEPLKALNLQLMANAPDGFVIEDWVVDPVRVLKTALEQAVSVGGNLATISSVITTKKKKYNAYVEGSTTQE